MQSCRHNGTRWYCSTLQEGGPNGALVVNAVQFIGAMVPDVRATDLSTELETE